MASIKKNLGLQTAYQILETCLPLITSPYLSRVLGASQLGIFSYTQSIANYFTMFAMLGFNNYGTRLIASVSENVKERSKTFWSIYSLQFAASLIAIIGYSGYLICVCKENLIIGIIQTLSIAACFLNINWLFFGLEKFAITVTHNMIIRVITVILILSLVKGPEDLWIYTLLMVSDTFFRQAVLWRYVPKVIQKARFTHSDIAGHVRPAINLFIPVLAMSVYHVMDKTMLGVLSNYEQSGFYYNADKVINIPLGIINGIGTVMLPRISALIAKKEVEKADSLFIQSMEGTILAACALAFGIAAIVREFVPLFFGTDYMPCVNLIVVLAPVLIIKGCTFSVRSQYLIPHNMDRVYIISAFVGAAVNLVINFVTIPILGAMGAVTGTLAAELTACFFQLWFIRKRIDCSKMLTHTLLFLVFGVVMFIMVRFVGNGLGRGWGVLILEIAAGVIVYSALAIIYLGISGKKAVMRDLLLRKK